MRRSRLVEPASDSALVASLAALRAELEVPGDYPAEALAEATQAAGSTPVTAPDLDDLRDVEFLTLDPVGSLDLDQAMCVTRHDGGATMHYAIADVPAFVRPGSALDAETRQRGQTLYAPDGRVPLHPDILGEGAASLLPDVDRRAFVWSFELDDGARPVTTRLRRATIRSRARWDYPAAAAAIADGSAPETLKALAWFGPHRERREQERGGASLNLPEIRVVPDGSTYRLEARRGLPIEDWNAHVSLMTGMAAAQLMIDGRIGILRTLPDATDEDIATFRQRTVALGIPWAPEVSYGQYLATLDRQDGAAMAVREAAASLFRGAGYLAFDGDVPPDHRQAAIGAPYAHTTAPLRRLVDRWSLVICEAVANDRPVPDWVRASLDEVPDLMRHSDQLASRLDSGIVDRVEAAVLHGHEGETFEGVVLASRKDGARVQLTAPPVEAKVPGITAEPGSTIPLRLEAADVATGTVSFVPVAVART